jgi:hypothetical protein
MYIKVCHVLAKRRGVHNQKFILIRPGILLARFIEEKVMFLTELR